LRPSATGVETERENRTKTIAVHGEALAARELAQASDAMMAHPLALQQPLDPGRAPSRQELHPSSSRRIDEHDRRARCFPDPREQSRGRARRGASPAVSLRKSRSGAVAPFAELVAALSAWLVFRDPSAWRSSYPTSPLPVAQPNRRATGAPGPFSRSVYDPIAYPVSELPPCPAARRGAARRSQRPRGAIAWRIRG
jgi:hypothetical protein